MENELNNNAAKLATVTEERNRIEDRMSSLEAAHLLAQDQANQLQVYRLLLWKQHCLIWIWLEGLHNHFSLKIYKKRRMSKWWHAKFKVFKTWSQTEFTNTHIDIFFFTVWLIISHFTWLNKTKHLMHFKQKLKQKIIELKLVSFSQFTKSHSIVVVLFHC